MRGRHITQTWLYNPTLYAPEKYRRACRYDAFIPDPISSLNFAMDARVAGIVSDAETAIHDLNHAAEPALTPLARLLLRTESIASSKVEGMLMNAGELARAEAKIDAGMSVGQVALEIVGNIDAMEYAVASSAESETFGLGEIVAIHRTLMERSATPHIAGQVRTSQNWIGGNNHNPCGADFVPPPPEFVDELLSDLCVAMSEASLPPLVQAAIVHAQFETIHPFGDGNGRTGRALVHVILRRRGIADSYVPPISVILAGDRDGYIAGLTRFRTGDVEAWVEQFAIATAQAATLARAYIQAARELIAEWTEQMRMYRDVRADAAALAIIHVLPAHPVVTASIATVATGRAKSAIHTAITDLQAAGVLVPLSQGKRNRAWEARGLLELLARLETGKLPHGN